MNALPPSGNIVRALAVLFVLCAWCSPASAQVPSVTVTRESVAAAEDSKPWLVCFVFDRSSSMRPSEGAGRGWWHDVIDDSQKKLDQLQSSLKSFDLRIYSFDSRASDFNRPYGARTFAISTAEDANLIKAELRRWPLPDRNQATNLWTSLRNIFDGIAASDASSRYSGVLVTVFSDGADSVSGGQSAESREAAMRSSLDRLRTKVNARISVLPIGEWRRPESKERLAQLRSMADLEELNKPIEIPKVIRLSVDPKLVPLPAMVDPGANSKVAVAFRGFEAADVRDVQVVLRSMPDGISIRPEAFTASGGELVVKTSRPLEDGGTGWIDLIVKDAAGVRRSISVQAAIPAVKRIPAASQWGLPPECASFGRLAVIQAGEPFQLALALPSDAKVTWKFDGITSGGSNSWFKSEPVSAGVHKVQVDVKTAEDSRSAEFSVLAVNPDMQMKGPDEIHAGDLATFEILQDPANPIVPKGFESLLGPEEWIDRTSESSSKLDVRFDRKGSERVTVRRKIMACGSDDVECRVTKIVKVKAGPAVRLLGGEVVRGLPERLEAELSEATQIAGVIFEIGGKRAEALISPATGDEPAKASVKWVFGKESTSLVRVVPILKNDSGTNRKESDPECQVRAQERTFAVVDPEADLVMSNPVDGAILSYGSPVSVQLRPDGRNGDQIQSIDVEVAPEQGPPIRSVLNAKGNWTWEFVPQPEWGASLKLKALGQFQQQGDLPRPSLERTHKLAAVKPSLAFGGDAASGTVSFTGRNATPPPVTVSVVSEGTDLYPASALAAVEWSVDPSLKITSQSDADRVIGLAASRSGTFAIRATVRTRDGKSYDLPRELTILPAPVIPGPELADASFDYREPIEIEHGGTSGAWSNTLIRHRRAGGEWKAIEPGARLDPLPSKEEQIDFEVWYQPWGAMDTKEPWSADSGWVRSQPMKGIATLPRDWLWPFVVVMCAIGLCCLWWRLTLPEKDWIGAWRWQGTPKSSRLDTTNTGSLASWDWVCYRRFRMNLRGLDIPEKEWQCVVEAELKVGRHAKLESTKEGVKETYPCEPISDKTGGKTITFVIPEDSVLGRLLNPPTATQKRYKVHKKNILLTAQPYKAGDPLRDFPSKKAPGPRGKEFMFGVGAFLILGVAGLLIVTGIV